MRVRKQRVWDPRSSVMTYLAIGEYGVKSVGETGVGNQDAAVVVMDWTGRMDSGQEEVYEGDLMTQHEGAPVLKVSWDHSLCGFVLVGGTWVAPLGYFVSESKKVGNIYEHPEMFQA